MTLSVYLRDRLFKAKDYRQFIKLILKEFETVRGYRKRLSDHAGCQPAYFSQVMAGNAELTPEHAERLCEFWELNELEGELFFNLVLLGRAGTLNLRRRLETKLQQLRKEREHAHETFGQPTLSAPERAAIYYSHWLHSAVHLLLTVPGYKNVAALSKHLRQTDDEIQEVLKGLERAGLTEKTTAGWRTSTMQIHASDKDFFAEVHHKNWRAKALETKYTSSESAVRYTSVHSLSKEDFEKVKTLMNELVEKSRLVITASPEEMGACLLIDYFSL